MADFSHQIEQFFDESVPS